MYSLIKVIDVLSPSEVELINSVYDGKKFKYTREVSKVFGDLDTNLKSHSMRSSVGFYLPDDDPTEIILHKKINRALDKYLELLTQVHPRFNDYPVPGGLDTVSYRESIQILEYTSGHHYDFHHDEADYPSQKEYHRKISVVLYLQNAELGGGTKFPHTVYRPKPGQALIFPSNWCFPHAGEPVTLGKKRVAVTWYYVDRQRKN